MSKLNVTFEKLIDDNKVINTNPDPNPDPKPNPDPAPAPTPDPKPDPTPKPDPSSDPKPDPNPKPDPDGDQDEPKTVIDIFKTSLGYEVDGEFEESLDGVLDYTRKAIPVAAQQIVEEIFTEYPEAELLIKHLRDGHSLDTFVEQFKKPELVKQEINENTPENVLERIVRENLAAKGLEKDDIDIYVNYAKDTKTLFDKAKKSFDEINKRHEDQVNLKKQQEAQRIKEIQDEQIKTWNKVNDIVNSGKIGNSIISDAEKVKFLEFISKPVKDNKTLRQIRFEEMDIEDHLYLDFLIFKDAIKRKASDSDKRKSLFEEMMKNRNPQRMTPSSSQQQKSQQQKNQLKDPRESLKGMTFDKLI